MTRPFRNGDEIAAFSRVGRRATNWKAGVRANVKTRANRRDRHEARAETRRFA